MSHQLCCVRYKKKEREHRKNVINHVAVRYKKKGCEYRKNVINYVVSATRKKNVNTEKACHREAPKIRKNVIPQNAEGVCAGSTHA